MKQVLVFIAMIAVGLVLVVGVMDMGEAGKALLESGRDSLQSIE